MAKRDKFTYYKVEFDERYHGLSPREPASMSAVRTIKESLPIPYNVSVDDAANQYATRHSLFPGQLKYTGRATVDEEMTAVIRKHRAPEGFLAKLLRQLGKKTTATASIVGVLGGIFFLSTNITGNAIANVSQGSGNILGIVLLVVGLVAGFFWVKKR
jgi:hypothetical protein